MKQPLKGPHHFTGITRDVTTNVDFWCRVMGMRFVKNTLNFETTFRYHTYFGDEEGNPGTVVTFLEFKEAKPGLPGDGDIHRLVLRVRSYDSLEYWMDRLIANDMHSEMLRLDPTQPQSLVFWDPENHEVELMVSDAHGHAARGRGRRHPGRAPDPRPGGRALVHHARGAAAVRRARRLSPRRHAARAGRRAQWPLVLLRAARPAVRRRPRRRLAPHRVRRRHRRGGAARPRRGQRGRPPMDAHLRPLLLRLVLLDVSRRADGDLHDGAWVSTRREARRPRRPPLSLASSGAASPQARARADADRQPAPAVQDKPRRAVNAQRRPGDRGRSRLLSHPHLRQRPGPGGHAPGPGRPRSHGLLATFFVIGASLRATPRVHRARRAPRGTGPATPRSPTRARWGRHGRRAAGDRRRPRRSSASRPPRPVVPALGRGGRARAGPALARRGRRAGRRRATRTCSGTRSPATGRPALGRAALVDIADATGRCSSCTTSPARAGPARRVSRRSTATSTQGFPPACVPIVDGRVVLDLERTL